MCWSAILNFKNALLGQKCQQVGRYGTTLRRNTFHITFWGLRRAHTYLSFPAFSHVPVFLNRCIAPTSFKKVHLCLRILPLLIWHWYARKNLYNIWNISQQLEPFWTIFKSHSSMKFTGCLWASLGAFWWRKVGCKCDK